MRASTGMPWRVRGLHQTVEAEACLTRGRNSIASSGAFVASLSNVSPTLKDRASNWQHGDSGHGVHTPPSTTIPPTTYLGSVRVRTLPSGPMGGLWKLPRCRWMARIRSTIGAPPNSTRELTLAWCSCCRFSWRRRPCAGCSHVSGAMPVGENIGHKTPAKTLRPGLPRTLQTDTTSCTCSRP